MDDAGRRAGRLAAAALGAVAFFFLALIQLPLFFGEFPRRPRTIDFANYLAAANVGLAAGWGRIYDRGLEGPVYLRLTGAPAFEWHHTFLSPPPLAWLVSPLARLPLDVAYWLWVAASVGLFAFACWRVVPWNGAARVAAVLVSFCCYPVLIAFQFGQVTPLIAAACVLALDELRRGRQLLAAALLVPIALKPQVGLLIPFALVLVGQRRLFVAWSAAVLTLTALSVVSLGQAGIQQYLDDARLVASHSDNQVWTLAWFFGQGNAATLAEGFVMALALATAWAWRRRRDPVAPFVLGALGSLLGAGYHHSIDFPSLVPLALSQASRFPPLVAVPFFIAGLAASLLTPRFGPAPLLAFTVAWMLVAAGAMWASLTKITLVNVIQRKGGRHHSVDDESDEQADGKG